MKLIYMDKTIIFISEERPELLEQIVNQNPEEIKQDKSSYFKIITDE